MKGLKPGTSDYMEQMRSNSNEIRDKLLRNIMIRRTRSEIMQYYEDDLKQQGLTFPKLDAPEKIEYVFDDVTDGIFNETIKAIKDFSYARYKPLTYLKNTKMYATMLTAQHNMGGFMKGILIKRLESSFYAFRMTLSRFIDSYERFINMYKQTGEVWISKKVDVYELIDSGDIESLIVYYDKTSHKLPHYPEIYREGFFRFSIGLEDAEDIISDLQQAMEKAKVL